MKQQTFAMAADQTFENYLKSTRREEFLKNMEAFVQWVALCEVIEPCHPNAGNGLPPIGLERMLRIHFIKHWFNFADVEAALMAAFGLKGYLVPKLRFSLIWLALLLWLMGRNNVNPGCNYDPGKFMALGFERLVMFAEGLEDHARLYRSAYLGQQEQQAG
jgi:hypothetical protein